MLSGAFLGIIKVFQSFEKVKFSLAKRAEIWYYNIR